MEEGNALSGRKKRMYEVEPGAKARYIDPALKSQYFFPDSIGR